MSSSFHCGSIVSAAFIALGGSLAQANQPATSPVKIFIMADQSNMDGKGQIASARRSRGEIQRHHFNLLIRSTPNSTT